MTRMQKHILRAELRRLQEEERAAFELGMKATSSLRVLAGRFPWVANVVLAA